MTDTSFPAHPETPTAGDVPKVTHLEARSDGVPFASPAGQGDDAPRPPTNPLHQGEE